MRKMLAQINDVPRNILAVFFLIAFVGGFFRELSKRVAMKDAVVSAGVSGIAGLVVGGLCVYAWGENRWYLTCAVVGASSWISGAVILDSIASIGWTLARKRFPGLPASPPTGSNSQPSTLIDTSQK